MSYNELRTTNYELRSRPHGTGKYKTMPLLSHHPYDALEAEEKQGFFQFLHAFGNNIYTRDNKVGHLTPSCWIVNKDRTKVLMIYHKIMDTWSWLGGHSDGEKDCLKVALKEAEEESGLKNIKVLSNKIFDINIMPSIVHIKKGKYVANHNHYNITYLFEADETEPLITNEQETKGVKWLNVDDILPNIPQERDRILYERLIKKVKEQKW